jgi:hypothetical protein
MRYVLILCLALLAGCNLFGTRTEPGHATSHTATADNSAGTQEIDIRLSNGTTVTVPPGGKLTVTTAESTQPSPPKEPATTTIDQEGRSVASSGAAAEIIGSILALQGHFWIGLLMVLAGGVLWLVKRQAVQAIASATPTGRLALLAAKLPQGTGLLVMATGAAVIVLPYFLEVGGWVIVLGGAGVVCLLLIKFGLNLFKIDLEQDNPYAAVSDERPRNEGAMT